MSIVNSEVDICNLALLDCGASFITSLTEESVEGRMCALLYPVTRDLLLRKRKWNFATKQIVPTKIAGSFGKFTDAFQLPQDCVKVVGLIDSPFEEYKEVGSVLYTMGGTNQIEYISNDVPVGRYDALFVDAFVAELAAKMIYKFNQSTNAQSAKVAKAKDTLREASNADSQIGTMRELEQDVFLQSRVSGVIY